MLLNRRSTLNVQQLQAKLPRFEDNLRLRTNEDIMLQLTDFARLNQLYESALNEVATKLENLDAEFHVNYNYNPIHHLEGRMKSPQSIAEKMVDKDLPINIPNIEENILDIAGIRVIVNYLDDIYSIEKLLSKQDDVTVIKRNDYVANPKDSGYRSLHLVISIPVFLSTETKHVNVEIQIRTIGMDMWASLEHKLRFKSDIEEIEQYSSELVSYSNELHSIEKKMQKINDALK